MTFLNRDGLETLVLKREIDLLTQAKADYCVLLADMTERCLAAEKQLAEREAEIAVLREALKMVEFIEGYDNESGTYTFCPCCDREKEHGHYECRLVEALSTPQSLSYLEQWEKEKYGEKFTVTWIDGICTIEPEDGRDYPTEFTELYARKD
jgi:hypothetical protein